MSYINWRINYNNNRIKIISAYYNCECIYILLIELNQVLKLNFKYIHVWYKYSLKRSRYNHLFNDLPM